METERMLKKVTLNFSTITNVLLSGIILTGNYRFEPKIIALTTACVTSNYAYIKLRKNARKN